MGDRDASGKFVKGNPGGPGRKKREVETDYLIALVKAVSMEDWEAIVHKAVVQARHGDAVARKWLADYIIGAPVQRQEVTGADGGRVEIVVTYESPTPITETP